MYRGLDMKGSSSNDSVIHKQGWSEVQHLVAHMTVQRMLLQVELLSVVWILFLFLFNKMSKLFENQSCS